MCSFCSSLDKTIFEVLFNSASLVVIKYIGKSFDLWVTISLLTIPYSKNVSIQSLQKYFSIISNRNISNTTNLSLTKK